MPPTPLPMAPMDQVSNQPALVPYVEETDTLPLPPPAIEPPVQAPIQPVQTAQAQPQAQPALVPYVEEQATVTPKLVPYVPEDAPRAEAAKPQGLSFDNIYEDAALGDIASRYYSELDGKGAPMHPRVAIARFMDDRTKVQGRTQDAVREAFQTRVGGPMSQEQRERAAYLQRYWEQLPNIGAEGGRGLIAGTILNLGAGATDVTNLVGPGVGRVISAVRGLAMPALQRIGITAAVDATATGLAETANQTSQIDVGVREGYDVPGIATAAGVGALVSTGGNVLADQLTRPAARNAPPITPQAAVIQEGKTGPVDTPTSYTQSVTGRIMQEAVDKFRPIAAIQERVTGVGGQSQDLLNASKAARATNDVDPALLPYFQYRMTAASDVRAREFLETAPILPPDRNAGINNSRYTRTNAPAFMKIIEPIQKAGQLENFDTYIKAKRARFIRDVRNDPANLNGKPPIKTQFDDVQVYVDKGYPLPQAQMMARTAIDDTIRAGDANPMFRQAANQYRDFMTNVLEYERRSGNISTQEFNNMLGRGMLNPNNVEFMYTPFSHSNKADGQGMMGRMFNTSDPAKKKLTGSTDNKDNFVKATSEHVARAIVAADRNRAKESFYNVVTKGIASGKIAPNTVAERVKINPRAAIQQFAMRSDAEEILRRQGVDTPLAQTPDVEVLRAMGKAGINVAEGTDMVVRNGVPEYWKIIDQDLAKALSSMSPNQQSAIIEAIAKPTRLYGNLITSNPVFVVKNAIRDTLSAFSLSPNGFVPVYGTAKGVYKAFTDTKAYHDALVQGLGFSGITNNPTVRNAARQAGAGAETPLARFYADTIDRLHNNFFSKGVQGYTDFISKIEMGTRIQEMELAKRAGMSEIGGAFAGREVATDFAMKGSNEFLNNYSKVTVFFNASLQGFYRTGRGIASNPGKVAALVLVPITAPDVAMHIFNSGEPAYDALMPEAKASNVMFPVYKGGYESALAYATGQSPNKPQVDYYIPIPKPFEFGAVGTMFNGIYDWLKSGNAGKATEAVTRAIGTNIPGFDWPTLAKPSIELATNTNWAGTPIVSESVKGRNPLEQFNENTGMYAVQAARLIEENTRWLNGGNRNGIELSPMQIDYVVKFAFAGVISAIPDIAKHQSWDEAAFGPRPSPRGDEFDPMRPWTILTSKFVVDTPIRNDANLNRFYEISKRVSELDAGSGAYDRDLYRILGLSENSSSGEAEAATVFSGTLKATVQTMSALGQAIQATRLAKNLSPDEKRLRMDAYTMQRSELARTSLEMIRRSQFSPQLMGGFFNQNPAANISTESK